MNAKELQEKADDLKLQWDDPEDRIQLLALQVWANIAVSLEIVAKALATWEQALLGQEKPEPMSYQEYEDDPDNPFRLS